MAKDLEDKKDLVEELTDAEPEKVTVEELDQAADDLDAALAETTEVPEGEAEGSEAGEGNGNVLNDPLADSESTEDIYSGNYRRDTSDRGIYTGGTKRDRMMSDTLGDYGEESRAERRRKRQAARRRKNIITVLICLLLAALIGCGAYAYMNGMFDNLPFLSSGKPAETQPAETETAAPAETEAETEAPAETESETAAAEITWEKDQDPDISKLVSDYYLALSEGNIEEMKKALDDTAVIDEEAVTNQTTFIDGYQDIATYVTKGAQEGEYGVYIQYAMKFKDIETPAPGLVPAYVRLDGNGELRLLRYEDFDNDISVYMGEVSKSQQVQDLAAEVNKAFEDAQAADENLKTFVEGLSGNGTGTDNAGGASTANGETAAATEESQAAEESSAAASQEAGSAGNVQFEEVDDIQYAKTQVKCRKTPVIDDNSEDYILVDAKTKVHVVGVSDEWCKVYLFDSNGTSGYIYKKYLTILPPDQWDE